MFHITDNFQPGAPITQVPASWFNKVASFLNNLIGDGATVDKGNPPVIRVDTAAIAKKLSDAGTAVDKTDQGADDDTDGDTWVWESGGKNGLMFDCYCRAEEDGNWHYLSRARLTFSKDGLLVRAEGLNGRREIEG